MNRIRAIKVLFALILISSAYHIYYKAQGFIQIRWHRKINVTRQSTYTQISTNEMKDNRTHPMPILIMTYMRSGSTFLGDILQASPDVFYIFEPLLGVESFPKPLKVLFGNDINGSYDEIARQILKDAFTCQIQKLPIKLLQFKYFIDVSRSNAEFSRCLANHTAISKCADTLREKCLGYRYILIKTIRLRAYQLMDLKEDFPDLKVVYMLRDPRPVLRSQIAYGLAKVMHINDSELVSQFCVNVTQDTHVIRMFKKFYPEDVHVVYHESFKDNPLSISKKLYKGLDIPFSPTAERRIAKLTSDGQNCTGRIYALCTSKYNSTFTISKWRTEIQFSFVSMVDSVCSNVYKLHGYIPFPNQEKLKDLSCQSHNAEKAILKHIWLQAGDEVNIP